MRKIACLLGLAATALLPAVAFAQVDARLLKYPDISATHISFVYGGDIWIVSKTGGVAQRLSSPRGEESFRVFRRTAPGWPSPRTTAATMTFT